MVENGSLRAFDHAKSERRNETRPSRVGRIRLTDDERDSVYIPRFDPRRDADLRQDLTILVLKRGDACRRGIQLSRKNFDTNLSPTNYYLPSLKLSGNCRYARKIQSFSPLHKSFYLIMLLRSHENRENQG